MSTRLLDEIGEDRRMLLQAAGIITRSRGMNRETFRRRMQVGHLKAARLLGLLDRCGIAAPSETARWVALMSAEALPAHLARLGLPASTADDWNAAHPIGTPVLAWPGTREDEPMTTRTRTPAWTLGHGAAVVSVEGYPGGIYLTHVDPVPASDAYEETP